LPLNVPIGTCGEFGLRAVGRRASLRGIARIAGRGTVGCGKRRGV